MAKSPEPWSTTPAWAFPSCISTAPRSATTSLSPGLTDYDKHALYLTFDVTRQIAARRQRHRPDAGQRPVPRAARRPAPAISVSPKPSCSSTWNTPMARARPWSPTIPGSSPPTVPSAPTTSTTAKNTTPAWKCAAGTAPALTIPSGKPRTVVAGPAGVLAAQMAEPMRVMETSSRFRSSQARPGVCIFDMGQNMVGWCRLHVTGPRAPRSRLRSRRNPPARRVVYTDNLRSARATDVYTLKGGATRSLGAALHLPRFPLRRGDRLSRASPTLLRSKAAWCTTTWRVPASFDQFQRTPQSDPPATSFWGMRGNYRSIPTDCPQRDERQGWLGDRSR